MIRHLLTRLLIAILRPEPVDAAVALNALNEERLTEVLRAHQTLLRYNLLSHQQWEIMQTSIWEYESSVGGVFAIDHETGAIL